jgi:DNA-binding Lrp family transcriptional regulator
MLRVIFDHLSIIKQQQSRGRKILEKDNQRESHKLRNVPNFNVEKKPLKGTEAALISELISNSRRSDRELARAIGVSQPTVSRMIKRLESEGVVNEYTMIPNFRKLGYSLCAFIFLRLKDLPAEGVEKVRQAVKESLSQSHFVIILLERGIGLSRDAVMVVLYKDYASYAEHRDIIRRFPYIQSSDVDSFLVDLNDNLHYRSLTFSSVAKDLLRSNPKKKNNA